MAIDGADVLLLADPGTGYESIGAQTGLTTDNSRNMVETTTKQDDHTKFVYGKQSGTISLEALYIETGGDRDSQAKLEDAVDNANKLILRRREDGTTIEEAEVLVESIEKNYPDDDASTLSVEFTKNEAWQTV